ncbi:hypothetical protein, partial [Microcoleus anatoxicus]|uniref:hypothetical protein n=1 Tax=Microcoleus anatoxicus TaxID=2705319 RepID=UPI0030C8E3BC
MVAPVSTAESSRGWLTYGRSPLRLYIWSIFLTTINSTNSPMTSTPTIATPLTWTQLEALTDFQVDRT